MNEVKTIGIDLAKNLLALHGVDAASKPVFRKMARRADVATGGGNGGNGRNSGSSWCHHRTPASGRHYSSPSWTGMTGYAALWTFELWVHITREPRFLSFGITTPK